MARNKRFKGAADKRDGGQFLAVPMAVLNSVAYIQLSLSAKALLWDIAAQYSGDNNGDLAIAMKILSPRGWKSQTTVRKARDELVEAGLIAETRRGARPNKASLYGLTWCNLDPCGGKLDISPVAFPRGAYKLKNPLPAITPKNASLTPNSGVAGPA